ncbi:hypothetical protein [Asanoa siamensis]|uniref:Uncharacterized protein n=1 Tax=Asanoa siamensis TaxID=926357 RepID=A0ABQ4CH30_9ACTN|nr:hypothetical protein [Asanoa siamensis]GIF70611.1 hypothetical protein Asi02nite_01290 [Asanoa siamensis]
MNRVEPPATPDDERPVDLSGDEFMLPEQTRDDTDRGWGERTDSNDDRLWEDVPPHWG